ncbi:hypothetical protein BH24ACI2_BH24ACI2_07180 [soil metagenome]
MLRRLVHQNEFSRGKVASANLPMCVECGIPIIKLELLTASLAIDFIMPLTISGKSIVIEITGLIYPEDVWYAQVRARDVAEISEKHLIKGEIVERLALIEMKKTIEVFNRF